jgi:hypothetical protein
VKHDAQAKAHAAKQPSPGAEKKATPKLRHRQKCSRVNAGEYGMLQLRRIQESAYNSSAYCENQLRINGLRNAGVVQW